MLFRQQFDGREHVSMRSVRYEDRGWFLTVNSRQKVRGNVPLDGNEIFEILTLPRSKFALRLRRVNEQGSGDSTSEMEDCFLGFSRDFDNYGKPSCYSSTQHLETHLEFIDVTT